MEENNELLGMNNEEVVTESGSKISGTTGAILGSVATIAAIAGFKALKKMVTKKKLKKEAEMELIDEEFEEDFEEDEVEDQQEK